MKYRHAQNVVSLRIVYNFCQFSLALVICLRFVFIEMFDNLLHIQCVGTTTSRETH